MRKSLQELENRIDWIDNTNIYQAIQQLKEVLAAMLVLIDQALPKEVEPD